MACLSQNQERFISLFVAALGTFLLWRALKRPDLPAADE